MTAILKDQSKNNSISLIKSALCYSDASLIEAELFIYLLTNSISAREERGNLINFFDYRAGSSLLVYFTVDIQIILAYLFIEEEKRILNTINDSYTHIVDSIVEPIDLLRFTHQVYGLNVGSYIEDIYRFNNFYTYISKYLNVDIPDNFLEGDAVIRDKVTDVFTICEYKSKFIDTYLDIVSSNNRFAAAKVLSEYFNYKPETTNIILQEVEKWLANNSI